MTTVGRSLIPMSTTIGTTESVCPECLRTIPAELVADGDDVVLAKACPDHGSSRTVVWRGAPAMTGWERCKTAAHPASPTTPVARGCPHDCGLCADHRQETCTALIEVTQRCNLRCPFCFASAGPQAPPDPDMATIEGWYRSVLASNGPCNVQLSGGEPTTRDDLPEIVALGRSLGFAFIQLNSNGVRLAADPDFVRRLAAAGLSSVFLQFDGTDDDIHRATRGRRLLDTKVAAIERCGEHGIGVVLVPTLVPGVNTGDIGAIVRFALARFPIVRGVHFQPVTYLGRYPEVPGDAERVTIPEVIRAIDEQTDGLVAASTLTTGGCEHARCSFHGNYVVMPDGRLIAWSRHPGDSCCSSDPVEAPLPSAADGAAKARAFVQAHWAGVSVGDDDVGDDDVGDDEAPDPAAPRSLGDWDIFLERQHTHSFVVSGMAFQDAWSLDLERLRECCIHTVAPDGRLIPFCAYNLTDRTGRALYRGVAVAP